MCGIITTNYGTFMNNDYLLPSGSGFYDIIQTCNSRTCKDYKIMLKKRTSMFRRVFLEISDGAIHQQ